MSRLPDLSLAHQLAITAAMLTALVLVLLRTRMVLRIGLGSRGYPPTWTGEQLAYLRGARASIGITLIATWVAFGIAQPYLPQRVPLDLSQAMILIGLLLQTYAWIALLVPANWRQSALANLKFRHAIIGLIACWIVLLGTSVYAIATLALPHAFHTPAMVSGVYA